MKRKLRVLACLVAASAAPAGAVSFTNTGSLVYHNDVAFVSFTLEQNASGIAIWTDSFQDGWNFDPIIALWRDGNLLGQNDDNPMFSAAQTIYDAGLYFGSLQAGSYQISITPFSNFAFGPRLEDGFENSAETPGPLYGNGHWQLHLTDGALPPIPEPSSAALLLAGAALLAGLRAARKHTRPPCPGLDRLK